MINFNMRSVQSISNSLLLMVVLASCNSGTPVKTQRDTLTAQKEHLVNELSDMIAKIFLKEEGDETNVQKASEYKKNADLLLSGLCGMLESKNILTNIGILIQDPLPEEKAKELQKFLQKLIDTKVTMNDKKLLRKTLHTLLPLEIEKTTELEVDLFLHKILDLMKVIKQIRKLT